MVFFLVFGTMTILGLLWWLRAVRCFSEGLRVIIIPKVMLSFPRWHHSHSLLSNGSCHYLWQSGNKAVFSSITSLSLPSFPPSIPSPSFYYSFYPSISPSIPPSIQASCRTDTLTSLSPRPLRSTCLFNIVSVVWLNQYFSGVGCYGNWVMETVFYSYHSVVVISLSE